ncbi:MAG TPA: hypothetical protein VNF71_00970 [Acidimicrobiales bacterium]|nr:hypothetical protein [Acidimicrobiales bacterium]
MIGPHNLPTSAAGRRREEPCPTPRRPEPPGSEKAARERRDLSPEEEVVAEAELALLSYEDLVLNLVNAWRQDRIDHQKFLAAMRAVLDEMDGI